MEKILVIDDDYSVLNQVSSILDKAGYQSFIAQDGEKGLELAQSLPLSLIICDIMMPGLNGFEVLERLNRDVVTSAIPFIFLTAKSNLEDIKKAMVLGADSYIIKPFKNVDLLNIIKIKLEKVKFHQNQKASEENIIPNNSIINNKLKENSSLLINIAGTPTLVKLHEIEYILAQGDYSSVFIIYKGKVLVKKSLKSWESALPEENFLRAHRSTILNINLIESIGKWSKRAYIIKMLHSQESFITSQRYTVKIKSTYKT